MGSFSDSLPIKWYLNGVPTFNEDKPVGIIKKKYSQKFNRSSRITAQYKDDSELGLQLIIKDNDGNEVKTINAAKEQLNGVWFYSWDFSFEEQNLNEGCYSFEVYSNATEGDGAVIIPSLIIAGDGSQAAYVEIDGDGAVTLPSLVPAGDGLNYPFVSEDFKLSDSLATVCDASITTLYFQNPFALGTHFYTEKEFINWPVGYNYIARVSTGLIYAYSDVDGTRGLNQPGSC